MKILSLGGMAQMLDVICSELSERKGEIKWTE